MLVLKRDGRWESWNVNKVRKAILACYPGLDPDLFVQEICSGFSGREKISVDDIAQAIVNCLRSHGYRKAADSFDRYRDVFHDKAMRPDPSAVQQYIHAAKYSRNGETYEQTCRRVFDMHKKIRGVEIDLDMLLSRKVLPSMRSMQFAGTAIEVNNARMFNCAFTLINRPEVFGQILFLLLSGCGVGYSVQVQHVNRLPKILRINRRDVQHHTIQDSIEGWAQAVYNLILAYMNFSHYVEFDYSHIRNEGLPLVTSGGIAPGHLELKRSLDDVRLILDKAQGRTLKPIECHDIICTLARCVVAGGIRRSALGCLFSLEDTEMLYCKTPGIFRPGDVRSFCNNSAVLTSRVGLDRVVELSQEFGEPGFFYTRNTDWGTNPCFEIGLNPNVTGFGLCNLTEVNCATCVDEHDFYARCIEAAKIGTIQATYSYMPMLGPATKQIMEEERLLGVSITGVMDNPDCLNWLREGARRVRLANIDWATKLGINAAARLTCVKPSGTASLLLGCVGSGIHPHHARRYFRRITASPLEGAAQRFREVNPHMVDVKPDGNLSLRFCVQTEGMTNKQLRDVEFLKTVRQVYREWVLPGHVRGDNTHNVSATCIVDDIARVTEYVGDNIADFAAVSFVPPTLDKVYPFAPREEVTTKADETMWNLSIENYRKVTYDSNRTIEPGCDSESCIV